MKNIFIIGLFLLGACSTNKKQKEEGIDGIHYDVAAEEYEFIVNHPRIKELVKPHFIISIRQGIQIGETYQVERSGRAGCIHLGISPGDGTNKPKLNYTLERPCLKSNEGLDIDTGKVVTFPEKPLRE